MQTQGSQTRDGGVEVPGEAAKERPCQELKTAWLRPQAHPYPLPEPDLSAACPPFAPAERFLHRLTKSLLQLCPLPVTQHLGQEAPPLGPDPCSSLVALPQNPCPQAQQVTLSGICLLQRAPAGLDGVRGEQEGTGHPGFQPHRRPGHPSLPSPRVTRTSCGPGAEQVASTCSWGK